MTLPSTCPKPKGQLEVNNLTKAITWRGYLTRNYEVNKLQIKRS